MKARLIPLFIQVLNQQLGKQKLQLIQASSPAHWASPLSYTINDVGQVITLNLKGARLTQLSITADWQHIKRLDISRNEFTELVFSKDMPQLELLEASFNTVPLEKLIFETTFAKLRYLYVYRSKLRGIDFRQGLPPALLDNDYNMNLGENELADDIKAILAEVDDGKRRYMLAYYFRQQKQTVKRAKLILLGNTDTGKTSLYDILKKEKLAGESTHGINLFNYTTQHVNEVIPVVGYDFGGQDYYHNTHFSCFGSNALYLLVWGKGQEDVYGTILRRGKMGMKQERIYPCNYWLGAVKYYISQNTRRQSNNETADAAIQPSAEEKSEPSYRTSMMPPSNQENVHLYLLYNRYKGENEAPTWTNQQDLKRDFPFIKGWKDYCLDAKTITAKEKKAIQQWVDERVQAFAEDQLVPTNGQNLATLMEKQDDVLLTVNELEQRAKEAGIKDDNFVLLLKGLNALLYCQYLAPDALASTQTAQLEVAQINNLSRYVIINPAKFIHWIYFILSEEIIDDGYFSREDARKSLRSNGIELDSEGYHLQFILDYMLYHRIIFKVRTQDKYIAPNYLPSVKSSAERLFLQTFAPALVVYEFTGFFHTHVITEILACYIQHKVPLEQTEKRGLLFVLWKNKVLLSQEDTDAGKALHQNKLLLIDFEPAPQLQQEVMGTTSLQQHQPTQPPMPGDRYPAIKLHRFANSQVSDDFIREVMAEIETIVKGYDCTKWVITPSQKNYIPFSQLTKEKELRQEGQLTGLVQYNNVLYRRGDFKLFINNPDAFPMKRLFISYSKDDLSMVNQFLKHLATLQRSGLIERWYCTELLPGSDWDANIQAHFDAADIVCFMVSPNFNATDYIYEYELKRAFERKQKDPHFKIIPIILKYCIWAIPGQYNLGKYSALPYIAKPVADFRDPDMAWLIVTESIRILCQNMELEPQGDDYYQQLAFSKPNKLSKQLLGFFERIVKGDFDNNFTRTEQKAESEEINNVEKNSSISGNNNSFNTKESLNKITNDDELVQAIFFSYAWGEEREKIVDQLYDALLADNYLVKRDKKDVQYGDSIVQFMDELGTSACIIVAISDHYLKSEYCMYELYKAYEQSNSDLNSLRNKIYPIRVETLELDRPAVLKSYIQHWQRLEAEWEDLVSSKSTRISAVQYKRYTRIKSIATKLGDLLDFLAYINASTTAILSQNNFEVIKKTIQQRMQG